MYYFSMKLIQYYEYLVNIVVTDGLVHQGIGSYSAEHAPMRFQLLISETWMYSRDRK